MSRLSDLLSPGARALSLHSLAPPRAPLQRSPLIQLDSNENPLGPSPLALQAIHAAMADANLYPDDDCSQLRTKLAAQHGVEPAQVIVTAGSTGLLNVLCQVLLTPGLNAVTSQQSFVVYKQLVQATGAQLIEVPLRDDGFDLAAILAAINPNTRLVLLANPNNPTGTMLDADAIEKFLSQVPDHVVIALDEAYYEYAAHFVALRGVAHWRSLDYVRQGTNVMALRTFSKVHGLAGLRIGYGFGPAELLTCCAQMRNTYSVSSVAEAAALAAMDDHEHIDRTLQLNADQRQVLTAELSSLGYRVVPTWANFLYCDLPKDMRTDARSFAAKLLEEGVVIRPLAAWGAPQCIRVSIGTAEQNQMFLNTVRKLRT